MRYENFRKDFNKTAIFSAQTYGTKTTVEVDHSDLDLDEVMDVFKTLIVGMGFNSDAFKQWVLEMAEEYKEEENDKWEDEEHVFHNEVKEAIKTKLKEEPHWNWDNDIEYNDSPVEKPKYGFDSDGFEDYQNEWGDEEETNWPEPNAELKEAAEEYKKVVKPAPKKRKKKSVEDWENEIDLGGHE